jgi:cobalt-zinc-cadmium resistance protein CzcA
MVVLMLFLGDLRSSLVVVATLILTPLLTFLAMNRLGISANLMSLGGLAIAIGLMVDGSVVVVENAFAHLARQGRSNVSRLRVIADAVGEVATPVIFGVGVIILVFLPLMTLKGMEGKMFAPLAFTIAIALFFSLLLSLTLTPVLSYYLLRVKPSKAGHDDDHDTWLIRKLKRPYLFLLNRAVDRPAMTVAASVAALAAALALVPFLGTAFIPEMKEGSVVPGINRVPNISLEESIRMEMQAMQLVMQVPGVIAVPAGPDTAHRRLPGRLLHRKDGSRRHDRRPNCPLRKRQSWIRSKAPSAVRRR